MQSQDHHHQENLITDKQHFLAFTNIVDHVILKIRI